jgi:hypothetical protein
VGDAYTSAHVRVLAVRAVLVLVAGRNIVGVRIVLVLVVIVVVIAVILFVPGISTYAPVLVTPTSISVAFAHALAIIVAVVGVVVVSRRMSRLQRVSMRRRRPPRPAVERTRSRTATRASSCDFGATIESRFKHGNGIHVTVADLRVGREDHIRDSELPSHESRIDHARASGRVLCVQRGVAEYRARALGRSNSCPGTASPCPWPVGHQGRCQEAGRH